MSQNLASVHFGPDQWVAVDEAITGVVQAFEPILLALAREKQRRLVKMGDGSEAFCRQALDVMEDNAGLLPRDFDIAEVRRDLEAHDALNARMVQLEKLMERMGDTELALGSDVMSASLEGYAFLKIAGKGQGVEALKAMLGRRFDTSGGEAAAPESKLEPVTPA